MADFNSKYSGEQVENLLDLVASGNAGGGGTQGPQGPEGPKGDDGVGIASVVQTTTSTADGGSNVVTVTLTDGKTSTFAVKNGSKGSQGEQGIQGVQGVQGVQGPKGDTGAEGPKGDKGEQGPKGDKGDKGDTGAAGTNGTNGTNGATFTPSVDSSGNLSWTNNGGLSNPPTVNIKGPKGDSGEGGGGGGKEYVEVEVLEEPMGAVVIFSRYTTLLQPNKVFFVKDVHIDSLAIHDIPKSDAVTDEYTIMFRANALCHISMPDYIKWPNGVIPDLSEGGDCELSIIRIRYLGVDSYKAVLTIFKNVE